MLTVWLADEHAIVIAIGRHDESPNDVYSGLLDALELESPTPNARAHLAAAKQEGHHRTNMSRPSLPRQSSGWREEFVPSDGDFLRQRPALERALGTGG